LVKKGYFTKLLQQTISVINSKAYLNLRFSKTLKFKILLLSNENSLVNALESFRNDLQKWSQFYLLMKSNFQFELNVAISRLMFVIVKFYILNWVISLYLFGIKTPDLQSNFE